MTKKTYIPRWINPAIPYSDLTIGEAEKREAWVRSLKAERNEGRLEKDAYAELASLLLG